MSTNYSVLVYVLTVHFMHSQCLEIWHWTFVRLVVKLQAIFISLKTGIHRNMKAACEGPIMDT